MFPMFRSLWPKRSLCPIPFLAPFLVRSLSDFAVGLEEDLLLCHVRALRIYLQRTASFSPRPRRLFVSPRRPSYSPSKNAVSFVLREVIAEADADRPEVDSVRAHSICSVSTSAAFHSNWSVVSVLEVATWHSNSVFALFYLRDIQHELDELRFLGPFVLRGKGSVSFHPFPLGGGGESSGPFRLFALRCYFPFWF